jgi:hypothetical protein
LGEEATKKFLGKHARRESQGLVSLVFKPEGRTTNFSKMSVTLIVLTQYDTQKTLK